MTPIERIASATHVPCGREHVHTGRSLATISSGLCLLLGIQSVLLMAQKPYLRPDHRNGGGSQARGIEVGLVAKLAGHADANVTLGHYTQAVRGGDAAIGALEQAYGG